MIKWTQLTVFVLANISFLCTVNGLPRHIKIGALFLEEQKGSAVELAFKYAVYKVNKDPDLLPNSSIHYDIEYVKLEDSFHTSKKVCRQIRNGVHAILGPSDPFLGSHVQSVCDALDIPHLDARLDINSEKKEFSINIYPAPNSLNKAFQDIMDFFNWTKVAIIYEDDYGLIKLQDLVRTPGPFNREVFFQQASSGSFLEILKDIKTREHYNIVVDISNGPSLKEFLRGVLKLHMNDYKYHYLFTTFDAETYDLEEFNYNFVNITSFRLVDSEHFRTIQIFKDMERFQTAGSALMNKSRILQAESAMIIDAVYTFALALQALDRGALLRRTNISCADEEPWADGSSLFNYINSKADLAIGSMTINFARESVIDFTKPFMNLGISILFKVSDREPVKLFSFMKPLTAEVWMYILLAYCLVSLTIYIVSKFSPNEWHDQHPCEDEPGIMRNQFSLSNSFWFAIGTLMQQGSDLNPKAASTRIISGIWWFFTLIMISSYTANLAAFLTVERMITPIESAEDLADQSEISYGTLESGSTLAFFRDSKIETYQKMWRFMENRKPSVFVSSYEEGIRRVLEGNYAFFMESNTLVYNIQRNCNLTQIGGLLDSKSYGIATPKGSPWRDKISLAILELQENGVIQLLYNKWWKAGGTCEKANENKNSKTNALALGPDSIGGVFVVLICGLAFSLLISVLEFCWKTRHMEPVTYDPQSEEADYEYSICTDIVNNCCYAIDCQAPSQRPVPPRRCSKCTYIRNSLDLTHTLQNNGDTRQWPEWDDDDFVDLQEQVTTNV